MDWYRSNRHPSRRLHDTNGRPEGQSRPRHGRLTRPAKTTPPTVLFRFTCQRTEVTDNKTTLHQQSAICMLSGKRRASDQPVNPSKEDISTSLLYTRAEAQIFTLRTQDQSLEEARFSSCQATTVTILRWLLVLPLSREGGKDANTKNQLPPAGDPAGMIRRRKRNEDGSVPHIEA